jgi:hypothetical protein
MLDHYLNGLGVFPSLLPLNAITSEQVIHHHPIRWRGMGGKALSFPSTYWCFVYHIIAKEILKSQI